MPPNGVSLSVKPLSIREFRSTPRRPDYGGHDKSATKSGALEIKARRTVRGDPCVSVREWFLKAVQERAVDRAPLARKRKDA
mgnify:CR=1 FL=1